MDACQLKLTAMGRMGLKPCGSMAGDAVTLYIYFPPLFRDNPKCTNVPHLYSKRNGIRIPFLFEYNKG
jgi:hypothetical protein